MVNPDRPELMEVYDLTVAQAETIANAAASPATGEALGLVLEAMWSLSRSRQRAHLEGHVSISRAIRVLPAYAAVRFGMLAPFVLQRLRLDDRLFVAHTLKALCELKLLQTAGGDDWNDVAGAPQDVLGLARACAEAAIMVAPV